MAEDGAGTPRRFGLVERHRPILAVAGRHHEACDAERRLFRALLEAPVEVNHRVVAGDGVCRNPIRGNERLARS